MPAAAASPVKAGKPVGGRGARPLQPSPSRPAARVVTSGYARLCARFPLKPLRSRTRLDRAVALIDELLDRPDSGTGALDTGERDYLDVLAMLVERYESDHRPVDHPGVAAMLNHLAEARAVAPDALAAAANLRAATLCGILDGTRRPSPRQLTRICRALCVAPAVVTGRSD